MKLVALSTLTLAAALAACASPQGVYAQQEAEDTTMSRKEILFTRVEALLKAKAWSPEAVGAALGLKTPLKKKAEKKHFTVYEGSAPKSSGLGVLQFRAPAGGAKGGMILIAADNGLTSADIMAKYGKKPHIMGPSGHAPDDPTYFVYPNGGGELRFGFKGEPARLVRVVVDRGESVLDR